MQAISILVQYIAQRVSTIESILFNDFVHLIENRCELCADLARHTSEGHEAIAITGEHNCNDDPSILLPHGKVVHQFILAAK